MNNEYVSFSAILDDREVRLTIPIDQLDIVTRDNTQKFDVESNVHLLNDIEYEDTY